MRSIKVSDAVYESLIELKRGNDTFDSVIRRIVTSHLVRTDVGKIHVRDNAGAAAGEGS